MAIAQYKKTDLKLENVLSSGDYIKHEAQKKINNTRTSMESKIAGEGDVCDINAVTSTDNTDVESAYEESFCSEDSENESELTNATRRSSISEIPSCRLTITRSAIRKPVITLNKKFVSTSKICEESCLSLEDKVKCLSLNEVRATRSVPVRSTRKNMSFTNDEILQIERDNEILLRKIMAQQKPQKRKIQPPQPKLSSSAINRKKFQRKIEEDNMILLRRLQQAKSCALSTNKVSGYRATYL